MIFISEGHLNIASVPDDGYIFIMQIERNIYPRSNGRVELRPHESADFSLYERWYADEDIWNLSSWRSGPMSPTETRRLFEERETSHADISFAIHLTEATTNEWNVRPGHPIGIIGLMNLNEVTSSADLSVIIGDRRHRGLGYGTEAMELLMSHGFEAVGLRRIALSVFDFNEKAIRTYERLGFKYDGRIRNAVTRDDGPHDAILMAITARRWSRLR